MQDGLTHETMTPWCPDEVKDSIGEVWSLYVGKQIDRPQFFKQYQEIWTNYAAKCARKCGHIPYAVRFEPYLEQVVGKNIK